jgi:ketosteroid isomerase-like protein
VPTKWIITSCPTFTRSFFMRSLQIVGIFSAGAALLLTLSVAQQSGRSDEGSYVLALDNSWNRALETKDTKGLDLLLADTFVSVDIDGSTQSKTEFLASIQAPSYHPELSVTEHSSAALYGDSAVVVGIFRTNGVDRGKKYANRERFVDMWIKINGSWKCVASTAVLIPAKHPSN